MGTADASRQDHNTGSVQPLNLQNLAANVTSMYEMETQQTRHMTGSISTAGASWSEPSKKEFDDAHRACYKRQKKDQAHDTRTLPAG